MSFNRNSQQQLSSTDQFDWRQFSDQGVVIERRDLLFLGTGELGSCGYGDFKFLGQNFYQTESFEIVPSQVLEVSKSDLESFLRQNQGEQVSRQQVGRKYRDESTSDRLEEEFRDEVLSIQSEITSGVVEKVIACGNRRLIWDPQRTSVAILGSLLRFLETPGGFTYGAWGYQSLMESGAGFFIGKSPEILFENTKQEPKSFKTYAIAGTRKTHAESETGLDSVRMSIKDVQALSAEFMNSGKDQHEHQIVVDDIQEVLQDLDQIEAVSVGSKETLSIGELVHLKTSIHFNFKNTIPNYSELVEKISPSAALSGFPRKVALEILKKNPSYRYQENQRFHGGSFGFVRGDEVYCLVAIRLFQWWKGEGLIVSGCGIVASSEPDEEVQEMKNKRRFVEERVSFEAG